jgi:hypothetical protein
MSPEERADSFVERLRPTSEWCLRGAEGTKDFWENLRGFLVEHLKAQGSDEADAALQKEEEPSDAPLRPRVGLCSRSVWQAEYAPVVFPAKPAKRCCAPSCGNEIKDGPMLKLTDGTGEVLYLEEDCIDWFMNGHWGGPRRLDGRDGSGRGQISTCWDWAPWPDTPLIAFREEPSDD